MDTGDFIQPGVFKRKSLPFITEKMRDFTLVRKDFLRHGDGWVLEAFYQET